MQFFCMMNIYLRTFTLLKKVKLFYAICQVQKLNPYQAEKKRDLKILVTLAYSLGKEC